MLAWIAEEVDAALASLERGNIESAKATLEDVKEALKQNALGTAGRPE